MYWQEAQDLWLSALQAEGRSPETIKGYRAHLVGFIRWSESTSVTNVEDLTPFHLRRFLNDYAQGRSPRTLRTVYGSLRTLLRWLVAEDILKASPTDRVKPPKAAQPSKKAYTPGELKAIFKHLESIKTTLGLRNYALVCLLADCGVRASESLSITLDDIQSGCVLLRETKGKRPRMVALGSRAEKALWHYVVRARPKLKPQGKNVFLSPNGTPMTRNALQCVLDGLAKNLGFAVSAHRFRHTWATMMLRKGVDVETLRRMGGWSDYQMLKTYAHLDVDDLKAAQARYSILDSL